jgi:electron transport complex protein RnfG
MKKKESNFKTMVLTLLVVTIASGVLLGAVNSITVGPKASAKLEKKLSALKLVLPEFNNNPVQNVELMIVKGIKDSVEIYPAFTNDIFSGAAVTGISEKGFSGTIKIMVGFTNEGKIKNIVVLEQKETPGLGTKIKDDSFINQFRDKDLSQFNLKVSKDGGEIDALTGATITTRAFCDATQMAFDAYMERKNVLIQKNAN